MCCQLSPWLASTAQRCAYARNGTAQASHLACVGTKPVRVSVHSPLHASHSASAKNDSTPSWTTQSGTVHSRASMRRTSPQRLSATRVSVALSWQKNCRVSSPALSRLGAPGAAHAASPAQPSVSGESRCARALQLAKLSAQFSTQCCVSRSVQHACTARHHEQTGTPGVSHGSTLTTAHSEHYAALQSTGNLRSGAGLAAAKSQVDSLCKAAPTRGLHSEKFVATTL